MPTFGEHLKALRKAKRVTQKEVAQSTGISERNYQDYEANVKKPGFDNLIALAEFFEISVDYLMGRTDKPQ